jgi:Gluconate 2-dehydrogenase subunit 3
MRDTTQHAPPEPPPSPRARRTWSRRRLFEAAIGALVVGGAALAVARTSGYPAPRGRVLAVLAPWQYRVIEHAARRIAAPDRPGDPSIPSPDDVDVASFADGWMARMPARVRRDLGRFLAYVEHVAPVVAGFVTRFTRLGPDDQDRVLSSIEASSSDLLRAGFEGLRSLVFLGFYRDPRTWRIVGYDGPLVARPAAGW